MSLQHPATSRDFQERRSSTFGRPSCRYREVWELLVDGKNSSRKSRWKSRFLFVVFVPCFCSSVFLVGFLRRLFFVNFGVFCHGHCHLVCACGCHCAVLMLVVAVVVVAWLPLMRLPSFSWSVWYVGCCLVFSSNRRAEQHWAAVVLTGVVGAINRFVMGTLPSICRITS